mmetsp:Transcript_110420/g.276418  ORF Transcript_110420/g.276418 Transcript_110420/m.276418 type:complete len:247 (-) Transcript_110420:98-838(-)
MEGWKKLLACAGGAAATAAVLYYLLREEDGSTLSPELVASDDGKKKLRVEDVTKEEVKQILDKILETQEVVKSRLKEITEDLKTKTVPLMETYERIKVVQPDDVLENLGITPADFDQLLGAHANDPEIRNGIVKIMGMPDPTTTTSQKDVSAKKVVEAHQYMLEQLEKVIGDFGQLPNRVSLDPKLLMQAAQAVVAARLEEKLGLTSDDMESALMKNQSTLATDQDFMIVQMKMQELMKQIVPGMP